MTTSGKWRWALGFAVAVFVGIVVAASLNQAAFTSQTITGAVIYALTAGSIYAIAASGLVVTYTTSGVFNFAQGAIGMIMAFLYWEVRINHGWPAWIALVFVVLIVAPLFGAVDRTHVDAPAGRRAARRPARGDHRPHVLPHGPGRDDLGRELDLARCPSSSPTSTASTSATSCSRGTGSSPSWWRCSIAIFLRILLYRSRTGVAMRAVVDNRELAALQRRTARPGVGAGVGAGLDDGGDRRDPAGAERRAAGRRAHAVHRRRVRRRHHRPAAQPAVDVRRRAHHRRRAELRPQLPAVGRSLGHRVDRDPRGDPVRRAAGAARGAPRGRAAWSPKHRVPRVPGLGRAASGLAAVVLVVALVAEFGGLDTTNLRRLTLALITALIMLSLVPLTGWAGQISLAQITFVGVGAFAMAEVAGDAQSWLGAGNPLGLLVAAAAAVPFGVLMALPALRLQGLYLALASMAFAVMAIPLFFSQPEIFGAAGRKLATPRFFGIDFDDAHNFLVLAAVVFAVRRALRRVVAARRVRSPAGRVARQPGGQRDRRRQPGVDQAAGVRAGGGDRRARRRPARHVPRHRRHPRLPDAGRDPVPAAAGGRRRRHGERRAHRRA